MIAVGGQILLSSAPEDFAALPGRRETVGNIETRNGKELSWIMVREDEGLQRAAHRALDIYMADGGRSSVSVLRKASPALYITGVEWEVVIAFQAPHEEGPKSG